MKKQIKWLFLFSVLFAGCEKELEQYPMDTTSKHAVFSSETGLKLYTNSFYEILPSANNIHTADCMSDYGARRAVPRFLIPGAYDANTSDDGSASGRDVVALGADADWEWEELRNVNYYIANANDPAIPSETQRHYLGVAKFFRAFLYFEKVKRFGDVPWFGKPIDVEDEDLLYGPRDPRTLVMDSVLADLNYACENIKTTSDNSCSQITKWVAYAFKSRICLYEGTFRKYHTELGLQNTAANWLNECITASEVVMIESGYKVYTTAGTDMSYRLLFTQNTPVTDEVMLAMIMNERLGETHSANWYYTSGTTGVRWNFIRTFINTYLMLDGTPFTDTPGYETMEFKEEMKGRDKRLKQTIRADDYDRIAAGAYVPTPPDFGYTYTGYQPIKWCLDDVQIDTRDLNTNSVSIFRFGEVLLNYAEARAELGTLTDADWAITVGALRARAGITGGLDAKPTTVDTYLQSNYFPEISDPVLLEIRRERGIELSFEGFRFYDLVRWKKGELMEMEWNGMYVPGIDTYLYLNEDTIPDVYFYKVKPSPLIPGVDYVDVSASSTLKLKNDTYGEITWLSSVERVWAEKNYYYPIPEEHIIVNPNLAQNPGW
jgi:hypothetical protein